MKFMLIILLLLISACSQTIEDTNNDKNITSFEDCINAGYSVMESYPRQCRDSLNRTFVEEVEVIACDRDTKNCGNGVYVGRNVNNNCEFFACPNEGQVVDIGTSKPMCENTCGNNVCDEIVCFGEGCPCAETPQSCPSDCS